jgi:HPt (histidine-containing phosphotransfer) domain-containing protein
MPDETIDRSAFDSLNQLGDAAFVQELIDTFLDEAPRLLDALRLALTDRNTDAFRRNAHSLKSNGKTFGAMTFAELARQLEFLGRDNQLGSVGDKLEKLAQEYARVAAALKGMRDG